MTEEVWINNHRLDVNPTDIQIITNRYSDSFNLTREDAPYAFVSPHGYTSVSMVLAFDITDDKSINQLISVYTQMDQFPFVWIKSHRLTGNISGFSQSTDGYAIYLLNTLTLRHTVDAQGVVFLNIELYYFNHTPLCHSWSFIDLTASKKQGKSLNKSAPADEQSYTFKSGLKPDESTLFKSYFRKEIKRRSGLSSNALRVAPNSLIFASPQWYPKKEELKDALNKNSLITGEAIYRDTEVDIYELSRYNSTNYSWAGTFDKTSVNDSSLAASQVSAKDIFSAQPQRETIQGYIAYINSTELSLEGLAIQDITLVKSNKIAMNKMAGYTEPMLQYMGKAPAVLNIEMIANGDGLYQENDNGKTDPISAGLSSSSMINALIAKIDSDSLINFKLAPFRNFKIRNPIVAMSGCKYFAFDKKIYAASSETQGQESLMLSFVESDLNSLGLKMQTKKVTAKPYYTDFSKMIKFIREVAVAFAQSSGYKTTQSTLIAPDSNRELGIPLATNNITDSIGSRKRNFAYSDNSPALILFNLNEALITILGIQHQKNGARIHITSQDKSDINTLISNLDLLRDNGTIGAFRVPNATYGTFEAAVRDQLVSDTQFAIEEAFYFLVYVATSQNNPLISSKFVTFANELIKSSNKDIEQIGGEALPDFHLGEHIDTELFPSVNPQKLNPFFFLEQNIYLNPELIKAAYDIASPVVDQHAKADNTREMLKLSDVHSYPVPEKLQLPPEKLQLPPEEQVPEEQNIDLSQVTLKRTSFKETIQKNTEIIRAEAALANIPAWIPLTIATIESGLGTVMRKKAAANKPELQSYWGIMQLGPGVRKTYGISGQPIEWWEQNTAYNVKVALKLDEKYIKPRLLLEIKRNPGLKIEPSWIYMLHQQGAGFASSLVKFSRGQRITRQEAIDNSAAQKVAGAVTPEDTINFFLDRFDTVASMFVSDRNERQRSFEQWLGVALNPAIPFRTIGANAATARGTSNQINIARIAQSGIGPNGAQYNTAYQGQAQVQELASQPFQNKPSRTFKGMNLDNIDIFGDDDQAQFRALRTGRYFEYGLNLAVPTAKIYIVEGNENNVLDRLYYRKRNLFEVYGVADVRIITSNEDEPVSVAVFSVLNPSSAYTDFDSIASHRLKIDPSRLDTRDEIFLKGKNLRLVPGAQIHIRMGFSNDPDELETVFNGEITEIDGESMLTIIAEGYGREMILREHATDKPHGVGGTLNSSTSSIIHETMRFDEIQHFGSRDPITNSKNPYARNILDGVSSISENGPSRLQNAAIYGMAGASVGALTYGVIGGVAVGVPAAIAGAVQTPNVIRAVGRNGEVNSSNDILDGDNVLPAIHMTASELFTNTYSPSIENVDSHYSLSDKSFMTIMFNPDRAYHVYFPIYQSTPWDVLSEMEYRHPNTRSQVLNYEQRATFFFGIKEQLYFAESPSIALINAVGSRVQAVFNNTALAENEKFRDLKPVADFHMFTTEHNIISNDLRISSKFGTQANIRYFEDNPSKRDFKNEDFKYYTMQSDDNLLPQAVKTFDINMLGVDHKSSAFRYGQVGLRKEAEKMYVGKIMVIGNPFIKGGDFAYLNDTQRELKGIIKIKECVHTYSAENGYITEITPALYVEEAMMTYSYLMAKMGLAFSMISEKLREKIFSSYMTANDYTSHVVKMVEGMLVDPQTFNDLKSIFAKDENKLGPITKQAVFLREFALLNIAGFGLSSVIAAFVRAEGLEFGTQTGVKAAARRGIINASKLANNLGRVIGASSSSAFEAIKRRVAQGAAVRGIGMMAARLAVTGLSMATGIVGAVVASPLFIPGMVIGIAVVYTMIKIREIEATRQPLRLFPLLHNGAPYIAGLAGWNDNSYYESLKLEARKTYAATGKLLNYGKDIYQARGDDFTILSSSLIQTRVDRIAEKYGASR